MGWTCEAENLVIEAVILAIIAVIVGGLTDADVIMVNNTGLNVSSLYIDSRNLHEMKPTDKLLISVSPERHHIKLVFRGGGDVEWPRFQFQGVHEIFFERDGVGFRARIE